MPHDKGNDIHINVPTVDIEKLIPGKGKVQRPEGSSEIARRVSEARTLQQKRFKKEHFHTNAGMRNRHIKTYVKISPGALSLLKQAVNAYNLSARTYFRLIKVSQTIADLATEPKIREAHVAEALQYRVRVEG